jgi:dihydropyrimidinase
VRSDIQFDLAVRGGLVVTEDRAGVCDIGIKDGTIAAMAIGLPQTARREIRADGMIVVPGAVDVHTHFANVIGGRPTADDYESGSRAAARGGITTFVNVAFQEHGEPLQDTAGKELAKSSGNSHIDFGVHLTITDPESPGVLDEIGPLADAGFASIKTFTAVPGLRLTDGQMLRVLERAAREGVMVNVHAEDEALISYLTGRLLASGRSAVRYLPDSRPPAAEAIATARTARYAAAVGCAVYFVHLSSELALNAVREARAEGAQVYAETRPVYLYLDKNRYELPDGVGKNYVCWPPLRDRSDQEALWQGLRDGAIDTYATDHTTYMSAEKMAGSQSFADVPGGVASVQTSIGMLYAEGVRKGRLSLSRFVQVTATNPAKLFGLWPSKGTLAPGSDADIVLIDPERRHRIKETERESRSDFEPYDGYEFTGWPVTVIARGDVIVEGGRVVSRPGRGRFLRRSRFQPPGPPAA